MVRVKWILNGGKRILYVDLSNLRDMDDILNTINLAVKNVRNRERKSVPILVNAYKLKLNLTSGEIIMNLLLENEEYIKAIAIIGLSGFKRRMLAKYISSYNRNDIRVFKNIEEAENWLIE